MKELIKDIKRFLSVKEQRKIAYLFVLLLFDAIMAAISVGVIPLYTAFMLNPAMANRVPYLHEYLPQMPEKITSFLAIIASIILLLVILVKSISTVFVAYVELRFVNHIEANINEKMFAVYQSAPYEWLLKKNSSEFVRKIQHDVNEVINKLLLPLVELAKNVLIMIFILGVMIASLDMMVMLILLFMSIGLYGFQSAIKNKIRKTGEIIRDELKNNIQQIQQGFGAIIDIRLLEREKYIHQEYRRSVRRAARARWRQGTYMRAMSPMVEVVSIIVLLSTFLFQINLYNSLEESLPGLTLLVVGVTRMKQISAVIVQSFNNIHIGRVYFPSMIEDYDNYIKNWGVKKSHQKDSPGHHFEELCLEKVSYGYDKTKELAIKEIDMVIRRGESIGLIGSTGSGKSTLVNVILGLLVPQSGEIEVNGVALQEDKSEWWRMIGYVPQSIYLIDNTIRANIAFGIPDDEIDKHRLENAIKSAQLEGFIRELPDGLDTIVGERGVRLSGGQRQRIGIARALYPDPQVLVMDEATSALDNQTEKEVMHAIETLMGEKTMIMIAHRLTTVQNCDRLYVMEKGRCVLSGHYDELVSQSS